MNIITITGRLTRDPEGRTTNTGKFCCNLSVAVDRRFKGQDATADFFRVTAWDFSPGKGPASFAGQFLKKVNRVAITGTMQSRKWSKDGVEQTTWEIIADNIEGLESKSSTADSGGNQAQGNRTPSRPPSTPADEYDPFADN